MALGGTGNAIAVVSPLAHLVKNGRRGDGIGRGAADGVRGQPLDRR
jgi:hypothetical protein